MYLELDRANVRGGLVGLGLFEKVRQRTYRLTPAGLAKAAETAGVDPSTRGRAERSLADQVVRILSHPVFTQWLKDHSDPKRFRDAGYFWGVAAGTPASAIRSRILEVDKTLEAAKSFLDQRNIDSIDAQHGRFLFDRTDIQRLIDFQNALKSRFANDLATLKVSLEEHT
jgi:hypothetical protein